MACPEIPSALWQRKKTAPHHYHKADQWGERGYFVVDGVVHTYAIDRKEQYDELIASDTVADFLEHSKDEAAKAWLRGLPALL